jgi:hypothetical protein
MEPRLILVNFLGDFDLFNTYFDLTWAGRVALDGDESNPSNSLLLIEMPRLSEDLSHEMDLYRLGLNRLKGGLCGLISDS